MLNVKYRYSSPRIESERGQRVQYIPLTRREVMSGAEQEVSRISHPSHYIWAYRTESGREHHQHIMPATVPRADGNVFTAPQLGVFFPCPVRGFERETSRAAIARSRVQPASVTDVLLPSPAILSLNKQYLLGINILDHTRRYGVETILR